MISRRVLLLIISAIFSLLALQTATAQVYTEASTSGFGAAFGYAQTIGNVAFAQTGGIGNADANAWANTPSLYAKSGVWTGGNAAAFSAAMDTPFGSQSIVQLSSFFSGMASGNAWAGK